MTKSLVRFRFTFLAAALAVIVVVTAMVLDIDLIELPFTGFTHIQPHEIDDISVAVALIFAAFVLDLAQERVRNAAHVQAEQLRVVHVTMRTVQDIVNNCLNRLQLVGMDAEGHVPPESLAIFDEAIQETTVKLKALGDLEVFAEKQMAAGAGLHVGEADSSS